MKTRHKSNCFLSRTDYHSWFLLFSEVSATIKLLATAGIPNFEGREAYVNSFYLSFKRAADDNWKDYRDTNGIVHKVRCLLD